MRGENGESLLCPAEMSMKLKIANLTQEDAKTICRWRYPPPYEIYNGPNWMTARAKQYGIADEATRRAEFYALKDGDALVGFFRLTGQLEFVRISLGLAPEKCGRGLGSKLMEMVLAVLKERYPGRPACLEVRTCNLRAIKCYERAGFSIRNEYRRNTPVGMADFYRMERLSF